MIPGRRQVYYSSMGWRTKVKARQIMAGGLALAALLSLAVAAAAAGVRPPVWAGKFYPRDPARLRQTMQRFVDQAGCRPPSAAKGKLRALVMPHAGYIYCGPTAARAACLLEPGAFDKVILLGPDHHVGFEGAAVSDATAFETPLGLVPLAPAATALRGRKPFKLVPEADRQEHSLEVILPWLQLRLGNFALIPVVLGDCDPRQVAAGLAPLVDRQTLVIASSDLSHYLPYQQAVKRDRRTLEALVRGQAGLLQEPNRACGHLGLEVLLNLAGQLGWQAEILNYTNSGDGAGDRSAVVGYAAVAFWGEKEMENKEKPDFELSQEQGRLLVKLARRSLLERFGRHAELEDLDSRLADPALEKHCGTFVTLTIGGNLRGCIGSLEGYEPLKDGVRRNAVNAAFHDPRFAPLSVEELDRVRIEVSVLTKPRLLEYKDADDLLRKLRPGIDGVIISKGLASATFLPQVWQQLPQPEAFLSHLCMKAGLPADQWRKGDLEVKVYQVQYFEEPD